MRTKGKQNKLVYFMANDVAVMISSDKAAIGISATVNTGQGSREQSIELILGSDIAMVLMKLLGELRDSFDLPDPDIETTQNHLQ